MTAIIIHQDGAPPARLELADGVYPIGSDERCRIHIPDASVSRKHALLTVSGGACFIEDLGSLNGTYINAEPVKRRAQITPSAPATIGRVTLALAPAGADAARAAALARGARAGNSGSTGNAENSGSTGNAARAAAADADAAQYSQNSQSAPPPSLHSPFPIPHSPTPSPQSPVPSPQSSPSPQSPVPSPQPPQSPVPSPQSAPTRGADYERRRSIKAQIHAELVERLDIKRLSTTRINADELRAKARDILASIIAEVRAKLPPAVDADEISTEILDEALGLGPLEKLLADDTVTEIMVNGPERIFVERSGRLTLAEQTFMDEHSVMAVIERIVAPIGRRVDESQPYVDARLADGSRVNCVIHPLSLIGPCITIRKFSKRQLFDRDMIAYGTLTEDMALFMDVCVKMRKNIIVSGGTGSGKTTLLNVLSNYLPPHERILTIEDAAELRLAQPHLVRLEARPPNIEGRGAVTIRDLVRNALRMRPDRIIVGECRGGEALDMLQAMNTGHDGSLTTVHANAPRDVISRLETMVLMSGMELPSRAIREQIASAVDIIIHESRLTDGSRKVVCISEVVGLEGNQITMQDIFEFVQTGLTTQGKVAGHFRPTGAVPTFMDELAARGIKLDISIFSPKR